MPTTTLSPSQLRGRWAAARGLQLTTDVATLALLAGGFWHVYFKPKPPCEDGSYCARPQSAWTTKAVLWLGLAVAILALTIDWWAPWFY